MGGRRNRNPSRKVTGKEGKRTLESRIGKDGELRRLRYEPLSRTAIKKPKTRRRVL